MLAMQAGIATMSVRLGAPQIFWTCIVLLEVAYAGAIAVGLMSPVRLQGHLHWFFLDRTRLYVDRLIGTSDLRCEI